MKKIYTVLHARTGKLTDFTSMKKATDYIIKTRFTFIVLNVKAVARLRADYKALQSDEYKV